MHLILILSPRDRSHNLVEIDDLILTEIPNTDDPLLRELILKWMTHNPFGELNPNASCMTNKKRKLQCGFGSLMQFNSVTSLAEDEKPKYWRRYDPKLDRMETNLHDHVVYSRASNNHQVTLMIVMSPHIILICSKNSDVTRKVMSKKMSNILAT